MGVLRVDNNHGIRSRRSLPEVLKPRVFMKGHVMEDEYKFYQVCIRPQPNGSFMKFTFQLNSLDGGDANLYISFSNPWPNVADFAYASFKRGNDSLEIYSNSEYAQGGEKRKLDSLVVPEVIFAGVFGRTNTSYKLQVNMVSASELEVKQLLENS